MALRTLVSSLRQGATQQILPPASLCGGLQQAMKPRQDEISCTQVRHSSQLILRQRMKSVGNIMKITKAMKMVAAARMRGAQNRVMECRGMVDPCVKLFGENPLVEGQKVATIPITSDKGLCGGVNSQVNKVTRMIQGVLPEGDEESRIAIVGDKGRAVLQRTNGKQIDNTFTEATKQSVTYATASAIAEDVLKSDYGVSHVLFNRFKSAIAFQPTVASVMSPETIEANQHIVEKFDEYELEGPDRSEFLQDLTEFQLAGTIYVGMLENGCSEQASRVQAMENSSKNASEMLNAITIKYNKTRQASITTELIEIISGAVALEG